MRSAITSTAEGGERAHASWTDLRLPVVGEAGSGFVTPVPGGGATAASGRSGSASGSVRTVRANPSPT